MLPLAVVAAEPALTSSKSRGERGAGKGHPGNAALDEKLSRVKNLTERNTPQ